MPKTKLRVGLARLVAVFLTIMLALQGIVPSVALAAQRTVGVDNHTLDRDGTTVVKDITIDGVDKPAPGSALDQTATVSASGGASWDVPVVWVRDDLAVGNGMAAEGHTYLPALAFFVPQGYALVEDVYTVTLADSLAELFGTEEIISVYDASSGITYILPASLKDLFARARTAEQTTSVAEAQTSEITPAAEVQANEQANDDIEGLGDGDTIVEVHCAKTARDILTDEDLQWLLELIIDYLEPQAVELLLNSFPAFRTAANNGEIGKEIGLYVYYKKGDKDGKPEHEGMPEALAYVTGDAAKINGAYKYCYLLAVDVDSLLRRDANGTPIRNEQTKGYTLIREGTNMETFKNTIVHELFHALMDDYNRTGMSGVTNLADLEVDQNNRFINPGASQRYATLRYPKWFVEGTASAVENVYQFRYGTFQMLRRNPGSNGKWGTGSCNDSFTSQLLINNYLNAYYSNGSFAYFDINYSVGGVDSDGDTIDTNASRYVTGYLATLYLCELSARQCYNGQSSVKTVNGMTTVDSAMLRTGLNSLLQRMHEGATLDEVINSVSRINGSNVPLYADTEAFQSLFIKGVRHGNSFDGDGESQRFVTNFLNYILSIDKPLPNNEAPNGSILFDFDKRFTSPLDSNKKSSSQYLQIANSNSLVPSTVKSDTSVIGGGKSNLDKPVGTASTTNGARPAETPLPAAAKPDASTTDEKNDTNDAVSNDTQDAAKSADETATNGATDGTNATDPASESAGTPGASDATKGEQGASESVGETRSVAEPAPAPAPETTPAPAPEAVPTTAPAPAPAPAPVPTEPVGVTTDQPIDQPIVQPTEPVASSQDVPEPAQETNGQQAA